MKRQSKGFSVFQLVRIIIAVCFYVAIFTYLAFKGVPALRDLVNPEAEETLESYDDIQQVATRLEQEILAGSHSFSFYSGKISSEEIKQINTHIDPTYGTASYQETEATTHGNSSLQDFKENPINMKTTLQISLKPAYYVYASILNGKAIPEKETEAIALEKKVKKILAKTIKDSMSDYQKELALHNYLVKHCKYSDVLSHAKTSHIYDAYGALVEHKAVCDGYAQALQLLYACAGVTSKYISGTATSDTGSMDHAWNLVKLGEDWYHVDATWNDPVPDRGKSTITHPYFNVPDAFIQGSHTWDASKYPKADAKKMNYYTRKKSRFSSWKKFKKAAYKALVTKKQSYYEAYIGKRNVDVHDLQFLYRGDGIDNQYSWTLIEEATGNILILMVN